MPDLLTILASGLGVFTPVVLFVLERWRRRKPVGGVETSGVVDSGDGDAVAVVAVAEMAHDVLSPREAAAWLYRQQADMEISIRRIRAPHLAGWVSWHKDLMSLAEDEETVSGVRHVHEGFDSLFRALGPPPDGGRAELEPVGRGDGGTER